MRIAIAGTGRVATCLATNLHAAGHTVTHIVSRYADKARDLAIPLKAQALVYHAMPKSIEADYLLLAVADDHIREVGERLSSIVVKTCLIVHHSGVGEVLDLGQYRTAILWPVYSVRHSTTILGTDIPLIVDGSDDHSIDKVEVLARSLSYRVARYPLEQRRRLHLGATISNNFVSHLINGVFEHFGKYDLDPLLLAPLILDGVQNRLAHRGTGGLTGPASRNDRTTIATHMHLLDDDASLQKLYQTITADILQKLETKTK